MNVKAELDNGRFELPLVKAATAELRSQNASSEEKTELVLSLARASWNSQTKLEHQAKVLHLEYNETSERLENENEVLRVNIDNINAALSETNLLIKKVAAEKKLISESLEAASAKQDLLEKALKQQTALEQSRKIDEIRKKWSEQIEYYTELSDICYALRAVRYATVIGFFIPNDLTKEYKRASAIREAYNDALETFNRNIRNSSFEQAYSTSKAQLKEAKLKAYKLLYDRGL